MQRNAGNVHNYWPLFRFLRDRNVTLAKANDRQKKIHSKTSMKAVIALQLVCTVLSLLLLLSVATATTEQHFARDHRPSLLQDRNNRPDAALFGAGDVNPRGHLFALNPRFASSDESSSASPPIALQEHKFLRTAALTTQAATTGGPVINCNLD